MAGHLGNVDDTTVERLKHVSSAAQTAGCRRFSQYQHLRALFLFFCDAKDFLILEIVGWDGNDPV